MAGMLPDVLSSDGKHVFMRHVQFGLDGERESPSVPHLFCPAGFLDDTWWHRTYWFVGTQMGTGYGGWPVVGRRLPAGRILVLDGERLFGFGRSVYTHTGSHVGIDSATVYHFRPNRDQPDRRIYYRLFAAKQPGQAAVPAAKARRAARPAGKRRPGQPSAKRPARPGLGLTLSAAKRQRPAAKARRGRAAAKPQAKRRPAQRRGRPGWQPTWTQRLPIWVRAMVLAGDRLYVAGPPDPLAADDPIAALSGKRGGELLVVNPDSGQPGQSVKLSSPPVFDGLIAASGRLITSTLEGKVICWTGR